MSTLTKPKAAVRKAIKKTKVKPRVRRVKNLPAGAIKLTERDYALDRLAGADVGPDDV